MRRRALRGRILGTAPVCRDWMPKGARKRIYGIQRGRMFYSLDARGMDYGWQFWQRGSGELFFAGLPHRVQERAVEREFWDAWRIGPERCIAAIASQDRPNAPSFWRASR